MLMPMLWTNDNDDLMNYDPFEEMDRAMNRMFRDFTGGHHSDTLGMKTDVIDEGKDYRLEAELPGFDKSDVHVELKDGVLNISASHKENKEEKDDKTGRYLRRERSEASYQRAFHVGKDVKPEDIHARYENGVLTLTIPKKDNAVEQKDDVRKIEIQ